VVVERPPDVTVPRTVAVPAKVKPAHAGAVGDELPQPAARAMQMSSEEIRAMIR